MNKSELVQVLADRAGYTKKEAAAALDNVLAVITECLANGERVQLMGFGCFEVKDRASHIGRNPRTGEVQEVPATKAPVFKAGKVLKDAVTK